MAIEVVSMALAEEREKYIALHRYTEREDIRTYGSRHRKCYPRTLVRRNPSPKLLWEGALAFQDLGVLVSTLTPVTSKPNAKEESFLQKM